MHSRLCFMIGGCRTRNGNHRRQEGAAAPFAPSRAPRRGKLVLDAFVQRDAAVPLPCSHDHLGDPHDMQTGVCGTRQCDPSYGCGWSHVMYLLVDDVRHFRKKSENFIYR